MSNVLSGVQVNQLKPRSKIIYDFALEQKKFHDDLSLLKNQFVEPLKVIKKGVSTSNSQSDLFYDTKKQVGVLKQSVQIIGGALEVRKLQAQSKELNNNQCSNFLEAVTQVSAPRATRQKCCKKKLRQPTHHCKTYSAFINF